MKSIYINFVVIILLVLSSCSKPKVPEQFNYTQTLEELIFKYTNLDELSRYTGLTKNDLVVLSLNSQQNENLNQALFELKEEFETDPSEAKAFIKENSNVVENFDSNIKLSKINSRSEIKKIEELKHIKFNDTINSHLTHTIIQRKQDFLDDKFSILNMFSLIYDRVTKNKEQIIESWNKDLNKTLNISEINSQLNNQISAYVDYITVLRSNQNIKENFKKPNVKIENKVEINSKLFSDNLIERLNYEIYNTVFLTILELIVAIIITTIINRIINRKINENLRNLGSANKSIWGKKNKSFLNKAIVSVAITAGALISGNEERKKYERKKRNLNIITTIVFLVGSYFLVGYQSNKLEKNIDSIISETISKHLESQNLDIINDLIYQTNSL